VGAVKWYLETAEQNHAPAQFSLRICYHEAWHHSAGINNREMKPKSILDCDDPQWEQIAKGILEKEHVVRLKHFDQERDLEAIYRLRDYARSKVKPPERFEGVFTIEGEELGI
jgi:hypothetical protein